MFPVDRKFQASVSKKNELLEIWNQDNAYSKATTSFYNEGFLYLEYLTKHWNQEYTWTHDDGKNG